MSYPQAESPILAQAVHLQHHESAAFKEIYGFAGSQGVVNLEGVLNMPRGRDSDTLVVMMHPTTSLQVLPVPRALAAAGLHVLCAGNRYFRNDTPLIMEKVAVDLGVYIRHAREVWGYRKVVLLGWSGGGPLALFYQSQAEKPTVRTTPAGDPADLVAAGLPPVDGIIFQAANISRARLLSQSIDPSVLDEHDPTRRTVELDIYDSRNPNKPPFSSDYVDFYRKAQLARLRRRTDMVQEVLEGLRKQGGKEQERGLLTHRTMADLRYVDPAIDPNDRPPGVCVSGDPESANSGPVGWARYSTLRSWLSQWSVDDSHVNGAEAAASITVPLMVMENSADEACPASDLPQIFAAAGSIDKTHHVIKGAKHYYQGQPELLAQATNLTLEWMRSRKLLAD
ncbi:alpha/beta hydrolase [Comamonadaceae bacterium G21597-S1]|nr:alpha/beta hydrolase [Comamonadaceae bacterium G21597-S1]